MDDKEKHLRWLQVMWDLHKNISREEKRKRSSRYLRILANSQGVV
jgi:hypothetical protein